MTQAPSYVAPIPANQSATFTAVGPDPGPYSNVNYLITVFASALVFGQNIFHTYTVGLSVSEQPSFYLTVPSISQTSTSATYGIKGTSTNGYAGTITPTVTPPGCASVTTAPGAITIPSNGTSPQTSFTLNAVGCAAGTYSITVSAGGATALASLVIQPAALAIVTGSLPNGQLQIPYNQTMQAAGGSPAYQWTVVSGSLPPGVTLNAGTGVLSGTPTAVCSPCSFTIQVADRASHTATQPLMLTILPANAVIITPTPAPIAVIPGGTWNFTANMAVNWSASIGFISSSGVYTATGTMPGTQVTIMATSQQNNAIYGSVTFDISGKLIDTYNLNGQRINVWISVDGASFNTTSSGQYVALLDPGQHMLYSAACQADPNHLLYVFDHWSWTDQNGIPQQSTGNALPISVSGDPPFEYDAYFRSQSGYYYVTTAVNPAGAGTLTMSPTGDPSGAGACSGWFSNGSTVTFTASASGNYGFTGFSGDLVTNCTNAPASCNGQSLTINGPRSVTANFQISDPSFIKTEVPNNVSNNRDSTTHWEPSSAVGPTWVHAYNSGSGEIGAATTAAWVNGAWQKSVVPSPDPSGTIGDLFLAYDGHSSGAGYILVGTGHEQYSSSLYFNTSPDGTNWGVWQTLFPGSQGVAWDYGSTAVDSTGRIIVGAVRYADTQNTSCADGFWVIISTSHGAPGSWSTPYQVAAPSHQPGTCDSVQGRTAEDRWGIGSRVAAAGSQFLVFTPHLQGGNQFQPQELYYYYETSPGVWYGTPGPYGGKFLSSFEAPLNNTSYSPPVRNSVTDIFYSPLLDASGNDAGTWAVTYQFKNGDYNNVAVCTNNPMGCYEINAATDDEFMNAVSVDPNGGVWISYLTYSSLTSRQLPLYHQTIYYKPGGTAQDWSGTTWAMGATGDANVDPSVWVQDNTADRCTLYCYAEGDYARISTNAYLGVDSPYVNSSGCQDEVKKTNCTGNDLWQIFAFDPKGTPPANAFHPKTIYHPIGGDLGLKGKPNPPGSRGVAPERRGKKH